LEIYRAAGKCLSDPSWPADGSLDLIQHQNAVLEFNSSGSAVRVRVPDLDIWSILEIEA
jgi:hypothetical protein